MGEGGWWGAFASLGVYSGKRLVMVHWDTTGWVFEV